MFESTKARLRDWSDRIDERLMGVTPQTNQTLSQRELGRLLVAPPAHEAVEFGLELADLNRAD